MTAAVLAVGDARRLDREIRLVATSIVSGMDRLKLLIDQAAAGEIHQALGFRSWADYLQDVFGQEHLRLGRDDRRELVNYLAGSGLSQRAIASVTNLDRSTVVRDLAAALQPVDGSGSVEPEPDPEPEPEPSSGSVEPELDDVDTADTIAPVVEIRPPSPAAAPRPVAPAPSAAPSSRPAPAPSSSAPTPLPVVGRDGKSYARQPAPTRPARRPDITKTAWKLAGDLLKINDRLVKLNADDRVDRHRDALRGSLWYQLERTIEVCQRLQAQLSPPELGIDAEVIDLHPAEPADVVVRLTRHSAIVEHGWSTAWGHLEAMGASRQKDHRSGLPSFPRQYADDLAAAVEMRGKTVRIITDAAAVVADD